MRAVNLIPTEDRRGAGGAAGRSGGAVYIVLAALAAIVLVVTAYTLSSRAVSDRQDKLARVERDAQTAEKQVASLQGFASFAAMRQKRIQTVTSIAQSRFNWSDTMHEIARVIPKDVALTSLIGTVAPGVALQGASGGGSTLRSVLTTPAVELAGCTTSQGNVARMMAAMRQVDGVRRVSLQSSAKPDGGGGGGTTGSGQAAGNTSGCADATGKRPQFSMVIFFDAKPQPSATSAAANGASQAASTTATTSTGGAK